MINKEFKITSDSYLLLFFLAIIWPVSIIILFTPGLSDLNRPLTDLITRFYLPTIIFQLLIFCALLLILKKENAKVSSVGLCRFKYIYFAYALIFLIVAGILLKLTSYFLNYPGIADFIRPDIIAPKSWVEITVWVIMSAGVAVVEETAYRGYLITRLTRLLKSKIAAVLIASLAFSAGHFYQGYGGVILIFFDGILLAGLFLYTRSLWPGIIAHFTYNIVAPFI